jgi:hypothetical protein
MELNGKKFLGAERNGKQLLKIHHGNNVVWEKPSAAFSFGNALSFDGINDKVTFPNSTLANGRTTLSMSMWVNIPLIGGDFQIGMRESPSNIFGLVRNSANSNGLLILNRKTGSGVGSYETYNNTRFNNYDEWAHLVILFDGYEPFQTRLKLYINGLYIGYDYIAPEPSTSIGSVGNFFEIGSMTTANNYSKAKVNEVAIWYGILTDEEIVNLYNEGNGDFASNYQADKLRRYYRFNGSGSDTVLLDEGLDQVNGTLSGFTGTYWVAH